MDDWETACYLNASQPRTLNVNKWVCVVLQALQGVDVPHLSLPVKTEAALTWVRDVTDATTVLIAAMSLTAVKFRFHYFRLPLNLLQTTSSTRFWTSEKKKSLCKQKKSKTCRRLLPNCLSHFETCSKPTQNLLKPKKIMWKCFEHDSSNRIWT